MVDAFQSHARLVEAEADGLCRKPRPVFQSKEALLLSSGDELPVNDNACRGVGVIGVNAENDDERLQLSQRYFPSSDHCWVS
jgi:hypothetical protein